MRNKIIVFLLFLFALVSHTARAHDNWVKSDYALGDFPLVSLEKAAKLIVSSQDDSVVKIAAQHLSQDIHSVTDQTPLIRNHLNGISGPVVLLGTLGKHSFIDQLVNDKKIDVSAIKGQWESFIITTVKNPFPNIPSALVIVGSDKRGTAFGAYELAQAIGVSPWQWWADVLPQKKSTLYISSPLKHFGTPSVKYRGIFINDEGWGIHQWAKHTFEPNAGGIGPKTYEKVFELLLRLKANTLWPAMHPTTTPFNANPENATLADTYGIVMGSSHAEPMLRNNVGEWTLPEDNYNYVTHKSTVHTYWEDRLKTNSQFENIYTLGMRGIHDSNIQGANTNTERIDLLQSILSDQRTLLKNYSTNPIAETPQMFCAYKEVLDLYRLGLDIPDDVTIVWPDDNFGYVRNFASPEEQKRAGGFGVYYHLSYLGAPMAYLWLNTTPPSLLWHEMEKSYAMGAKNIWILNVGDIKPGEIGIEMFMQMAWDINRWTIDSIDNFLAEWAAREFGEPHAPAIADIMRKYYALNYQRKPEHLQWWLPRTTPAPSPMSLNEQKQRLDDFIAIQKHAIKIAKQLPPHKRAAYFQLVEYPVAASSLANQRFIYGEQQRERLAKKAHIELTQLTKFFNANVSNGKWNHFIQEEPADELWQKYRISPWQMPTYAKNSTSNKKFKQSIAVEAEDFSATENTAQGSWKIIPGLGRTGKGSIGVYPSDTPPISTQDILSKAPVVTYPVKIKQAGAVEIIFYLIPTHPINGDSLRFAFSLGAEYPTEVKLASLVGSPEWAQGVLNATRIIRQTVTLKHAGNYQLKLYGTDAGVLIDKVVINIDGVPENYLGLK
jgi:hypothetical protein